MEEVKLTSLVRSSGCNAKLPPGELHKVIDSLPVRQSEMLIEGFESADDALVYDIGGDRVLIETVDFFPPMVDDPYRFGQIAAANAISDIYAMGGEPKIAMSLMCFPSCLDISVMKRIMEGAMAKTDEAGVVIAGGHTISDREPKFGLAVTGFADKNAVWSNKGAVPGDKAVLTKKLGVGILMTALKAGEAAASDAEAAIEQMCTLNKKAKEMAEGLSVHAATDVTGFSLLGHSSEVAAAPVFQLRLILLPSDSSLVRLKRHAMVSFRKEDIQTRITLLRWCHSRRILIKRFQMLCILLRHQAACFCSCHSAMLINM